MQRKMAKAEQQQLILNAAIKKNLHTNYATDRRLKRKKLYHSHFRRLANANERAKETEELFFPLALRSTKTSLCSESSEWIVFSQLVLPVWVFCFGP